MVYSMTFSHKNWLNWRSSWGWFVAIRFRHWTYSVAFEPDIERGIQIRWTGNRAAVPQSTIVKKEKEFGYRANNFSLGNGSPIPGSTDLNATFNVGFKSNWVRLLSGTLRIVFQSHLVLCASMRLIVRNDFTFCFLHYFSNFFSKFWHFIIVINSIFLANSINSLKSWLRSKLPEIQEYFNRTIFFMWHHLIYQLFF